jgi:hypothetical protein
MPARPRANPGAPGGRVEAQSPHHGRPAWDAVPKVCQAETPNPRCRSLSPRA